MSASERELRQLAGRCLAMGLPGPELDASSRSVLREVRPGTVILFARNTPDVATTRRLCDQLQALAAAEGLGSLLVCADQEGGRVQRLRVGVAELPAPMLLGQAGPEHVRAVCEVAARDLIRAGIPLVLAPVADVNLEPENPVIGFRAFGADTRTVCACVTAAVEGYHAGGVLSCAKHFPGHGDTRVDSHLGLPVLRRTRAQLEEVELLPFRAAIEAGVDAVMVGHLAVPEVDPTGTPASLSGAITTGLLRQGLGWSGPILTDDLEMGAIADLGAGEIAVRAMAAGSDLLFFSHSHDRVRAAWDALVAAVLDGRVLEARLREAADHVTGLAERAWAAAEVSAGEVDGAAVVEAAARAGVQVVRPPFTSPAGEGDPVAVLSLVDRRMTGAESVGSGDPLLVAARRRGVAVEPDLDAAAAGSGPLVVGVRRPSAEILARLDGLSRRRPTTVIALAEPWPLERLRGAGAIAACDGGRAACERALDLALG